MSENLSYDDLKTELNKLTEELELVKHELWLKNEEIDFLRHKLFGRSKETTPASVNKLSLFDGIPPIEDSTELPEEVYEPKKRKKQKGKKRKL